MLLHLGKCAIFSFQQVHAPAPTVNVSEHFGGGPHAHHGGLGLQQPLGFRGQAQHLVGLVARAAGAQELRQRAVFGAGRPPGTVVYVGRTEA